MDEPTTHLDMASIDALIGALEQFSGTLIFISHDVYFIRKLAKHVLHVDSGKLTHYHGDYQYYLDKSAKLVPVAPVAPPPPAPDAKPTIREQKRRDSETRQASGRELREAQKRVSTLEAEIAKLEKSQLELTAELELPATYEKPGRAVEINRQLTGVTDALARVVPEWEAAVARLNALPAKTA